MVAVRMNGDFNDHIPVLLQETIQHLVIDPRGLYVDATFGRGSHSRAILDQLNDQGRLIAFDKDLEAVAYAKAHFSHDSRFTIEHGSFANMDQVLGNQAEVMGILFDFGVSSPQLDNPARGFSFSRDGDLDMRMDKSHGLTAAEWIQQVDEETLANVLWEYGEEKRSRRIAHAITLARLQSPLRTTSQLAKVIMDATPRHRYEDKHPATRSFQAIRMHINEELGDIRLGLAAAYRLLAVKGRLVTISFHSLEDRLVKQFIRLHEKGKEVPRGLPIKGDAFVSQLKMLSKPIKPSSFELAINPRARSAILRVAEKQS